MLQCKNKTLSLSFVCLIFLITGCLVSGTFMIVESFPFTTQDGFYPAAVNLTTNEIWIEHADKLDEVESVGFELWITNNETSDWTYTGYLDDYDPDCMTQSCFDTSTTKKIVFGPITIPASTGSSGTQKFVSYAESFGYLHNVEDLISKTQDGMLNVIGIATGGAGGNGGSVDSLRIIVTINASDS